MGARDYFIRISGGDDAAQFYGLELAFTEETQIEPPVVGVSEPGMAILFLMGIAAIGLRRRKK